MSGVQVGHEWGTGGTWVGYKWDMDGVQVGHGWGNRKCIHTLCLLKTP